MKERAWRKAEAQAEAPVKVWKAGREGWEVEESEVGRSRAEVVERSFSERLGVVEDEDLRYGAEAQQLRIEVTMAIRNEVLKLRRVRGLPDEDPKRGLAETFRREGPKREGVMADQSVVRDT